MEGPREIVVPDASVIDKWFVEEEHSDAALNLREDYIARRVEIAAPHLLPFEVLNSLRHNPDFGLRDLVQVAEALDRYGFWLLPLSGQASRLTLEKATEYGITVYDASYLSVAEMKEAMMYTADQRLLGKLREARSVRHISRYVESGKA